MLFAHFFNYFRSFDRMIGPGLVSCFWAQARRHGSRHGPRHGTVAGAAVAGSGVNILRAASYAWRWCWRWCWRSAESVDDELCITISFQPREISNNDGNRATEKTQNCTSCRASRKLPQQSAWRGAGNRLRIFLRWVLRRKKLLQGYYRLIVGRRN